MITTKAETQKRQFQPFVYVVAIGALVLLAVQDVMAAVLAMSDGEWAVMSIAVMMVFGCTVAISYLAKAYTRARGARAVRL